MSGPGADATGRPPVIDIHAIAVTVAEKPDRLAGLATVALLTDDIPPA